MPTPVGRRLSFISVVRLRSRDERTRVIPGGRFLPEGLNYTDAAQLCLWLYCTVEGVPPHLLPLDKERLGEAFAELSGAGWVQQSPENGDTTNPAIGSS